MEIKRELAFSIIILAFFVAITLIGWQFSQFPKISQIKFKKITRPAEITSLGLASGKQIYEIITEKPKDPQIIEVVVNPLDVELGKTQIVTVKVKTKATTITQEDLVRGQALTDNKITNFSLKLKKVEGEEELITTWQGEWKREDTIEKNYQIKILAKNINGENQVTLTFR